ADDDRLALVREKPHETSRIPADSLFDFDRAILKANSDRELLKWVKVLNDLRGESVMIEGHTDSTGQPDYNKRLSLQRAIAIQSWFVKMGVKGALTFSVNGFGEERPVASNATPEGRQMNRRVEIKFR